MVKNLLFKIHRWTGVALAVFMLLWLASGLVIVYAGSLPVSRAQQLAHSQTLAPEAGWLSLGEAWQRSAEARKARDAKNGAYSALDARLTRVDGTPVWQVEDERGQRFAVSALDGSVLDITGEQAVRIARNWLGLSAGQTAVSFIDTQQAISSLRNYTAFKPFHRVAVDDGAGSEVLVSARTGEVLQAAKSWQRGLFLAGNWLHMFRFLDSVGLEESRRDVLMWAGGIAFAAALTGMIVGWLRWRPGFFGRPTYAQGRTQPYRSFWFRWHFWSGLVGGTISLLWAFSGYLVNNPFQAFSAATASRDEVVRYYDRQLPDVAAQWRPAPVAAAEGSDIVELGWRRLGGQAVLLAHTRDGRRLPQALPGTVAAFDDLAVQAAATRLGQGKAPVAGLERLNEYDSYYYPNHRQGPLERPLPVVRVDLADESGTRLYVDPQDGALLLKQDSSRRAYRWLFSAIHHWDIGWLYLRPVWDAWMLTWIGFGLVLAVSSVVIGWRRLRLTFRSRRPEPEFEDGLATAPSTTS